MKLAIKRGNKGTPKRSKLAARDGLIFLIGININTGLRVNDLVRLKIHNVKNKTIFDLREGKTHKRREINIGMLHINDSLRMSPFSKKYLIMPHLVLRNAILALDKMKSMPH